MRLASKVNPFPQSGLGAYKGTRWDPAAKIAPGQVARNSNLRLGDRPRGEPPCYSIPFVIENETVRIAWNLP